MWTLRVLFSGDEILRRQPWPLSPGVAAIGRAPEGGGIVLPDDDRLSRTHASVICSPSGLRLLDEDSRNGTQVNSVPVTEVDLVEGDIIRVGGTLLHVRREALECSDASIPELVGEAPSMRELRSAVAMLGPYEVCVLILGESGSGKSLVAKCIHQASGRTGPFVAVNSGAIPAGLAESAFFGHKQGSFTGASADQRGYFRAAERGTIFIDEIGELPLALQPKLLHVVEEHAVTPVGSTRPLPSDVRIVAATNVDIIEAMRKGAFRGDLYSRLAEMVLRIPPLRERREDILPLIAMSLGEGAPRLSADLAEALLTYSWPFNVRELIATSRELLIRGAHRNRLELNMVRERLRAFDRSPVTPAKTQKPQAQTIRRSRDMPSRDEVVQLLRENRGVISKVASASGRSRQQVYRWLTRYELDPTDYR